MTTPFNKRQSSQIGQNRKANVTHKPEAKPNNLLQLKDQLVKMKQFLNQQMPVLSKLVTTHNQRQEKQFQINPGQQGSLSHEQLIQIVNTNRRLAEQNQKLSQMLIKQRSIKKKLNSSLHKQERMLTNLYQQTHRNLHSNHPGMKQYARKLSNDKSVSLKLTQFNGNSSTKKIEKLTKSLAKQKVNIWHGRSFSRQNFQKFASDTSINAYHNDRAQNSRKVTCQYSSSEEQTILTLQQLNFLQLKMQDLIKQSQKTDSRSKKLQIRRQLQKIAIKINQLRNTLNKA